MCRRIAYLVSCSGGLVVYCNATEEMLLLLAFVCLFLLRDGCARVVIIIDYHGIDLLLPNSDEGRRRFGSDHVYDVILENIGFSLGLLSLCATDYCHGYFCDDCRGKKKRTVLCDPPDLCCPVSNKKRENEERIHQQQS